VRIEALLQLVPALVGRETSITPLAGGITNRNFRVDADGRSFVLSIGGEHTELLGIDRKVEYECSLAAARSGLGPEVIAFLPEYRALVTRFVDGSVLAPEDLQQEPAMRRVAATLRRYHDGPQGAGQFSPFATVRNYFALARDRGVVFPANIGVALSLLERIEGVLQQIEAPCPCHNDLLPANFLDDGSSIWVIDWEYAGMGDRFFDLGNLAANHCFKEVQERMLLELYFGEVRERDLRRLRLMRLVSDMRESLWGFLQSAVSSLDFDFREYGQTHLQRFLKGAKVLETSPGALSIFGS
jgi:thiamine kinase-like enzyme